MQKSLPQLGFFNLGIKLGLIKSVHQFLYAELTIPGQAAAIVDERRLDIFYLLKKVSSMRAIKTFSWQS